MRRSKLGIFAVGLLVFLLGVGWWVWWRPVAVMYEIAGERFEVSSIRIKVFLWANGYGKPGERLRIVYTDQKQEGVVFGDGPDASAAFRMLSPR